MEEDRESGVIDPKKQKKLSFLSSTHKAKKTKCSPDYIRCRRSAITQTPVMDTEGHQEEQSLKTVGVRMKRNIARELFPNKTLAHEQYKGMVRNTQWSIGWYTDDDEEQLRDLNDGEQEIEGYASENDKDTLYGLTEHETCENIGDWSKFDDTSMHTMVLYNGQKFRDVSEFRKAIRVFAIREGFNLCVMENGSHVVCCECSDLRCDWVIQAARVLKGMTFVVTEFKPEHKCTRLPQQLQIRSKWIAAMYLHRWIKQPNVSTIEIRDEIKATYGVVCPQWKLYSAANRAKQILGMDHEDGYAMLNQFKEEMERVDSHNIVLLDTEKHESGVGRRLKRMFVCWERTCYAFKNHCRGLLAVDGWKINNPYKSVMLMAAALDGNNGILPVAFCEVEVEDLDSWVYFLKNINNALRLENGKGLCILGDGDNGIDYAVEEYLPLAAYRQCCRKVFTEMVKRFPTAPVQHLFWSACRSTSRTAFHKYMDLICHESPECHDWLLQTNWSSWALFSIPEWVKCTCVTLLITEKLRNYFHQYLDMSIARRFAAIARSTASLFEQRRMVVWKWYKEKVTPTVRDVVHDSTIDGQRFLVVEHNGTRLKLSDATSAFYDLNMEAMSCNCGLWQISGIPCPHACRVIQLNMGNVEDYVDNMMSVKNFWSMYAPGMTPLPKEHASKLGAGDIVLPPITPHPKVISAKGSNEIVPNKVIERTTGCSHAATSNLQWTQERNITRFAEQRDCPRMRSSSSDVSISF